VAVAFAKDRPWMGERAERLERRLERPMLVVAALVIPALVLEGANVDEGWKALAVVLNWIIWLAFLGELVSMLAVVRSRRGYLRHNVLTVAIVVLTPPFVPALLQSLRALRLLRLTRLMRLARLAPLFKLAFGLRGLKYASVFTLLVVLTGAAAFEGVEPGKSYFDGVYWAVSTMTTVGYGDELPTNVEAKVLAMALMLVGIGYFAVITGAIAERFIERGEDERVEAAQEQAPDDLSTQVDQIALRVRDLAEDLEALRRAIGSRH
jgi:voltage-gated potassium channel